MATPGIDSADLTLAVRSSEVVVPRDIEGRIPLLTNDAGERLLPLFSTIETLERWTKSGGYGIVMGQHAFAMAEELKVNAVVIDPAGPVRVEFGQEDIRRLAR